MGFTHCPYQKGQTGTASGKIPRLLCAAVAFQLRKDLLRLGIQGVLEAEGRQVSHLQILGLEEIEVKAEWE